LTAALALIVPLTAAPWTASAVVPGSETVKINEVESSGGTPGDWVELINNGAAAADISGYIVKDNDDTHIFTIPAGTSIAAGGYYVADVDPIFGLGAADSARLFAPDGTTLVDSYSWTAHAATTYGRCPNGTGAFTTTTTSTRGAANICPGDVIALPWPGGTTVATADDVNVFGTNLSGLAYQPSGSAEPGVLWAVRNGPSTLYRLVYDGTKWTPDTANGWSQGKQLRYPDGTGDPDAEGVSLVDGDPANGVYVSTERNNSANTISRPAVLRFDVSSSSTTLVATTDWNLTADLPPLGPNLGLEAVVWMSDDFLVSKGFLDEHTGAPYHPADYANHGKGLFFVGAEANGVIYAYSLDQVTGGFTRIATIASGFPAIMELEFEPESSHLWAVCDDTCNGRTATLDIAQTGANAGRFVVTDVYERPAGMPNINNEGFAIAPQSECDNGLKPVFWSDDNNTDSHALRVGTINCTDLDADNDGINDDVDVTFPPGTSQASNPTNGTFSDVLLNGTTSGAIINRNEQSVGIQDAPNPAGVQVTIGKTTPATLPATFRLTGSAATIALDRGTYALTKSGTTTSIAALDGGPAVVTLTVLATPITLIVGAGSSVTYTEVLAEGAVAGLSMTQSGTVDVYGDDMAAGSCGGIAVQNVIIGTVGNDRINGTQGNDLIIAKGGNDTVNGNGGSDCIDAGAGNDKVTTTTGDDRIYARSGNNTIDAGSGNNAVTTGTANDQITTGDGSDTIDAGAGNNTVSGGGGSDTITTGTGNDTVDCGGGTDVAHAGAGNNTNVGKHCELFAA
jgi:Ca2+-binding RTX toxin-like protein